MLMENPLVSIIINCFNGEEFLQEALDSVGNQVYKNWEIVFWDNCSIDKSADIAKSFSDKLRYFKSKVYMPLGEARKKALEQCNGKYVSFLDCDDIWCSNQKLSEQVKMLEENPDYALCYGSIEEVLIDKSHFRFVINKLDSGYIFQDLLLQFEIPIITTTLRRSFLLENNLSFDTNIKASEEYCLFMQIASIYPVGVSKNVMTKYRVHTSSLTSKSLSILGYERRYTLDLILQKKPILREKFLKEFQEAYARAAYYDSRWYMYNKEHFKAFRSLSKYALLDYRYFFLTILTLFPVFFWNKVHFSKRNRV